MDTNLLDFFLSIWLLNLIYHCCVLSGSSRGDLLLEMRLVLLSSNRLLFASVAIWYNLMGFLAISCVVTLFPANFVIYSGTILYQLIALGVVASFLQILLTSSYRYADAVVISSMRYLQMPLSGLVGYFIFAEIMTTTEIIGAAIIIASCLVIVWRELVRGRATRPLAAADS